MSRPFQFKLRSIFVLMFAVGALITVARLFGPDSPLADALFVAGVIGAAIGRRYGATARGAWLGVLLPIAYVLSIRILEHAGQRMGWPGATLKVWELYSALWFNMGVGSGAIWSAYWQWETWCEVMEERFGTEAPLGLLSLCALSLVCAGMLLVRRLGRAAYVAPFGVVLLAISLAATHDFDAAAAGFVTGSLGAIAMNRRGAAPA
jgi:hypothetical protein